MSVLLNPFDIVVKIVGVIDYLRSGDVSDVVSLMIAILPFIALGAYYFSYRVSCKVYMKGVERTFADCDIVVIEWSCTC